MAASWAFGSFSPLVLVFLFLTARGLLIPILPLYLDSIGLSIIEIGLAFAAFGASLLGVRDSVKFVVVI